MTDTDISNAVAAATSEENFDALAFFAGASLPEDSVTIYADAGAAYRLVEIRDAEKARATRSASEGLSLTDEVEYTDEDEVTELTERLKSSAVIFKLRGLAPAARKAISDKARVNRPSNNDEESPEFVEEYNVNLIARTIVSVSNAKGAQDKNQWDAARVRGFVESVDPSQFDKLFTAVYRVNYLGDAIDRAVTADFS